MSEEILSSVAQLELAARHYESINLELEQLKASLASKSLSITKSQSGILHSEKLLNKEFAKQRRLLLSKSSSMSLNFGIVTPQMLENMDTMVIEHLRQTGFETVASLIETERISKSKSASLSTAQADSKDEFETQAEQLFNQVLEGKLSPNLPLDAEFSEWINTKSVELQFYRALSKGVECAFVFLTSQGSKSPDLLQRLSGELVSLSPPVAIAKFEQLQKQVINRILLHFGCQTHSHEVKSDLEKLVEISQKILDQHSKELKMTKWSPDSELPFEFDLGKEYQYHPVFVCPITREQLIGDSIVMLECGHLISNEAFRTIKVSNTSVKCPYCPENTSVGMEKSVSFI